MKKTGLMLLCLAVFLLAVAGGGAYLYLSPRGALHPEGPEEMVQASLNDRDLAYWRAEYIRLCAPAVTEFEDAADVAGKLFDAAAGQEPLTFREEAGGSRTETAYILSAGEADLLRLRTQYRDGQWQMETEPLDALWAETHSITVLLPEDAALTVNGRAVDRRYISESGVLYPDMTALERRFAAYPTRVRYTIDGLYERPGVEAERAGGLVLLSADGASWEYTVPDAAGYAFAVTAPQEAAVMVNGAALTPEELVGSSVYATALDIPGELQSELPAYVSYAAGGLYTPPEITAALPDGTALTPETDGAGLVTFVLPGSEALYAEHHERVESFLRQLIEYGAGHTGRNDPGGFVAAGSPVGAYIRNAIASLQWTVNVTLTFQTVETFEYIPLGGSAFLCRGHVDCTTSTFYQTKEIPLDYEMLWIDQDGAWRLQDLAFA